VVRADPRDCSFQFDPLGSRAFDSSCDIAKGALARSGVGYANEAARSGEMAQVRIGGQALASFSGQAMTKAQLTASRAAWSAELSVLLKAAGYPAKADPARVNRPLVIALLMLLGTFGAMSYGPLAAALVEMFPAKIRTTALSLPYHLGNGWVGGFMPTSAFAITAATGNLYAGLWYPVFFALLSVVVGGLFLRNKRGGDISA